MFTRGHKTVSVLFTGSDHIDPLDRGLEAAWRWRFQRKWRREAAEATNMENIVNPQGRDAWDVALEYLQAAGAGMMHVALLVVCSHGGSCCSFACWVGSCDCDAYAG